MAMEYFLKQINPANASPLIICLDTDEVIVGRRSIVSLNGFNKVSRKHARFVNKNGRWFVRDLESLNKLYVNFKEVNTKWIPLEIGDIIGFGTPSYIEDGGLVCVFAARNRVKQEIFDEIEPDIGTKNDNDVHNVYRIEDDKSLPVKRELSPSKDGDCQKKITDYKTECSFQTDASSLSSSMLNNAAISKINSSNIIEPNNVTASQNQYESYSKELKPVIKTELNETDDKGLLSVIKTSPTPNGMINSNLNVENINAHNDSETASTTEVKFSLKNSIEGKKLLCKDVSSKIMKESSNEYCTEVGEKTSLNYFINDEKKVLEFSDKSQTKKSNNDQKIKDSKYFHNQTKKCSVRLIRCDSKYFRWPSEVNFPKITSSIEEDAKKTDSHYSETRRKQNSKCHLMRKKLRESLREEENTVQVALNLKVNKNRILSSSSEMSSDENEFEKQNANISNNITSDRKRTKTKSKKQAKVEKNQHTLRDNSTLLDETSRASKVFEKRRQFKKSQDTFRDNSTLLNETSKVSEKRKQCFVENHSTKRIKRDKGSENISSFNDFVDYHSAASAVSKSAGLRNKEISSYSTDESAFYVQRNSYCSKYWTPEFNQFETGELQESFKSNVCIKTKQTAGRTLLTDPKPMEYRSRRMRGREEWFKEQYSCRDSDQNERMSDNINEKISCTSTNVSKSANQRFVSSKKHYSTVNRKFSTEQPSSQTITPSKGNTTVTSQKNSTKPFSSEPNAASKDHFSIDNRAFPTELPSSQTITSLKRNISVSNQKNSTESIFSQSVDSSRANDSVGNRKNSLELISSKTLVASSENSSTRRKNSIEIISNASIPSSKDNSCMGNQEQSIQEKPDNSVLIKSTADKIRMNPSQSVPRRRDSSGCRPRFLVEIQMNADETTNNDLTTKDKLPPPLEKKDSSSTAMVKPTEIINVYPFPTVENEKKNSKNMDNNAAIVSPNRRMASLSALVVKSSFEDKRHIDSSTQKSIGENELAMFESSDTATIIEPHRTNTISKTSDTQFLPKEGIAPVSTSLLEDKQTNLKKQKVNGENDLSTYISELKPTLTKTIAETRDPQLSPKEVLAPIFTSSIDGNEQMNRRKQEGIKENELSTYKPSGKTSKIEPKVLKAVSKRNDAQFLPKEIFSKNDKIPNDRKVAIVSPVNHDNFQPNNLNQPDSAPNFHAAIEEKITNRVHSTYILSPIKSKSKPIHSNSDSTSIEDAADSTPDSKFRSRYLIKNIILWNPKWLEEQAKNKKPPPMVSKGGSVLPLRYSSYESYIKSFYPMISLEIWECLFRESKPLWLEKEGKNAFYYIVRSNKVQHGFMELQCESLVNENLSFLPREGNIVLLGLSNLENGLENSLFGYIHRHKIESAFETEKMKEWQDVPKEWQENAKLWNFSLHIKKSKKNFATGSVSLAYGIFNIKNKLQLADALVVFKDSPIQNDILRPTKEMFSFCKSISKIPRTQLIQTVSEEIKKENPHSKLILINAPAATGKTGAIIGIAEKLLFGNASKIKLLLCALSDMTVNEIGFRLMELNERCSWRGNYIKFVRFGKSENIPAKLQVYTLERKALKMFKEQNKKDFQDREKELKVLEDKINDVLFKEQLKTNDKYRFRKSNDEALKQLMNKLQFLKDKSFYTNMDPVVQATYESTILSESDVVLATLNSCMHPLMRKFFKSCKDESHACCIIDEISQCTELEVLQCLHPEINRLVLVGDLQQLPPLVSSNCAIKWGFKRSMLERISKLFSVQFSCTPPLSLAEQHRMQSQICHFPSIYFYKEQLLTAAEVDERYQYCPLKPFVVYDILEREMPNPPVNIEDNEPFIIANICAQLLQRVSTASLGVIVPHEDLAALYRIPLSLGNDALKGIEVNTVENYQGIEKDIIIISCVNPSLFAENDSFLSCEKKMNVALTRARQSLIICGHVSSVTQYKHWSALISDAKLRKSFISVSSLRQIPFVIMKTICRMS